MWKWIKALFFEHPITPKEIDEKIREALGVKWIQSMQRLDVKDGDILVIRLRECLSPSAAASFRGAVKEVIQKYGFNVHVMVFDQGTEIGILRKSG